MIEVDAKSLPFLKVLNYRKRKANINVTTHVTLCDLNWSGGTRSEYHTMSLVTGETLSHAHFSNPAPWNNHREGVTVEIPLDTIVIRTGHFCGKASTATIYVHPDNMAKLLPKE